MNARLGAVIALLVLICSTLTEAAPSKVRLVLVIDHSASMGMQTVDVRNAVADFIDGLDDLRNEAGLVVHGATGFVAFPLAPGFRTATPSMPELIRLIKYGSNTGTAEGLSLAYLELARNPDPNAINVILLITDGLPNGISAEFNDPDPTLNVLRTDSRCLHKPPNQAGFPLSGAIAQIASFDPSRTDGAVGILKLRSEACTDVKKCLASPVEQVLTGPASQGCAFAFSRTSFARDIRQFPAQDLYGNSTSGSAYSESRLYKKYAIPLDMTAVGNPYQIGLVSWNAAENAAARIRRDKRMKILIHTVGVVGVGSEHPDLLLLKRISNVGDPKNSAYDPESLSGVTTTVTDSQNLRWLLSTLAAILHIAAP